MACSKEKDADSLKQKRPSLSLGKRRFSKVSEAELSNCKKKPTSANTERAHQWALRVFEEWVCTDPNAEVSDLWSEDAEKVCHLLSKFAAEARQFNGKPYTPKTLLQLMTNLQSQAFAKNPRACNFMDYKDVVFKPLHNVLNNMSKKLLSQGVGAEKKQARVITDVEEDMLWEKKVMGSHSPVTLQNSVFFYCGLYFCLRGGSEHRDLKYSQFQVKEVQDPVESARMVKCVVHQEHSSKNHQGLLHQVHLDNKIVTHYADESLGERCFVKLFEQYILKIPDAAKEKDLFYCKPKKTPSEDGAWYYSTPIGHNLLACRLKDMFISAGMDIENIQNHSLRATGISRMYAKGIPEKQIMERSGHQR